MQLTGYGDFEGVMTEVAAERGWTFRDGDEPVAAETVFNEETFGPAILKLAGEELASRGIELELAVHFTAAPDSLLGVSAAFDDAHNSVLAASWRICLAAYVVEHLPQIEQDYDLALLRGVFAPQPAVAGAMA